MPWLAADLVIVLPAQAEALEALVRAHSTSQQLALRARMILHAADNIGVRESAGNSTCGRRRCGIGASAGVKRPMGSRCRAALRCAALGRAGDIHPRADLRGDRDDLREAVGERAADQPLEPARDCRRSDTTWPGSKHLAALGGAVFKKEADLKPHRFRYWLTPKPDPAFNAKCADICEVYQAAAGADDSHRTVSIDEMTGIQALERAAPGLPMKPGKVERCEFEYRRHGTQTLIAGFNVTTGKVAGVIGDTRSEQALHVFSTPC